MHIDMQTEKLAKYKRDAIFSIASLLIFEVVMEKILEKAAKAFNILLPIRYHIVLGRKGKSFDIVVVFNPENFFHLAGLHKLKKSYSFAKNSHEKVFKLIVKDKITTNMIKDDENFSVIYDRLRIIQNIACLIESNNTMFYSFDIRKVSIGSRLKANYMAKGLMNNQEFAFTFFIESSIESSTYCLNSVFLNDSYDYSKKQTQYTVLLKERIKVAIDEEFRDTLFRHKKYTD